MNTVNKKLTKLIAGRTIKRLSQAEKRLKIEFSDGSLITINSSNPAPDCVGRVVKTIKQGDTDFKIEFADGSSVQLTLAEETSSVLLRDKAEMLEYAD